MIPDWRVYSLLFRFIAHHWSEKPDAILAYLRAIGLGGEGPIKDRAQLDTLIATAQEFSRRALELDTSLKEALKRNPNLNLDSELHRLGHDKEQLTLQTVSLLEARLGLPDAAKVRLHIGKMKQKIKMVQTVP